MVSGVDVLLFDEPLANLDPAAGKKAVELIDEIQKRTGCAVIINAVPVRYRYNATCFRYNCKRPRRLFPFSNFLSPLGLSCFAVLGYFQRPVTIIDLIVIAALFWLPVT